LGVGPVGHPSPRVPATGHGDLGVPQGRAVPLRDRKTVHLFLDGEFRTAHDPPQGLLGAGGDLRLLEHEFRVGEGRQHTVGVPQFPLPQPVHRMSFQLLVPVSGRPHRPVWSCMVGSFSKNPTVLKPSPEILAAMSVRHEQAPDRPLEGETRRLTEESLPCHTTSRTETPNIEGSSTFRLNRGTVCRARTSFRSVSFLGCSMTTLTVQSALLALTDYWAEHGCVITQPSNVEVGAGTLNGSTFLRVLGPEPWRVAYVEPSVRPDDARYGLNPNRLQ